MEYRVLARKYRPTNFADLIGQEVLVRTLSNAIASGRLAHAWLLTGIRGIGKTTTARIIARALNCIGPEGNGGPTIEPCGVCPNCKMIAEDRHVDVLEMDAASRTGVGDIRELIETVHYAPTNARYKIYIIDEVHMLSGSAFNALLKTLEEPPPHVKFIFATTEIRKIPVTILSRCQRFDLRRVEIEGLAKHLANICVKEDIAAEAEALTIIATAAEGSVRDSLSLLDQAIAHATEGGVTASAVRDMLGMADKAQSFRLLKPLAQGDLPGAIAELKQLYHQGADPIMMLQDLLELVHFITRLKLVPELAHDVAYTEQERTEGKALAEKLSTAALTRLWQMLLKGLQEARFAPHPLTAIEMLFVRIAYAADLPPPAEIIRSLQGQSQLPAPRAAVQSYTTTPAINGDVVPAMASHQNLALAEPVARAWEAPVAARPALTLVTPEPVTLGSFEELVKLFAARKEMVLYSYLQHDVRPVSFAPGQLEISARSPLPNDFTARIARHLQEWTGERWAVSLTKHEGEATLAEREAAHQQAQLEEAAKHPLVAQILELFPGAVLAEVVDKP